MKLRRSRSCKVTEFGTNRKLICDFLLVLITNIFTFTFVICHRPSVCRLSSVTFVRPTQPVEIFGNVSTPSGTGPLVYLQVKFYGDRPRGTPLSRGLNARGVAEYSDYGPLDGYISQTVQDMRKVSINH